MEIGGHKSVLRMMRRSEAVVVEHTATTAGHVASADDAEMDAASLEVRIPSFY